MRAGKLFGIRSVFRMIGEADDLGPGCALRE